MSALYIAQNLFIGVLLSSVIGFNRKLKSSPAGIRTYNLVCLGAIIITMAAVEMSESAVKLVVENPDLKNVLNWDSSKIIGQIVSGVGFLGAGTIIISKQKILGLSTASSLWVTAAIGIAVGMRFYLLAVISTMLVVFILAFFNKLTPKYKLTILSVTIDDLQDEHEILQYFRMHHMVIESVETRVFTEQGTKKVRNTYTIKQPQENDTHTVILELAQLAYISEIEVL